jgi:hypothetical protein
MSALYRSTVAWIVTLALATSGCTLIGLGIGSAIDHQNANIPGWRLETLKPDTRVDVRLTDGTYVTGRFAGLERDFGEAYRAQYEGARGAAEDGADLPALGPVTLERADGGSTAAKLVGFDPGTAWLSFPDTARPRAMPLGVVARLASGGRTFKGDRLAALVRAGQIPVASAILVGDLPDRVPLSRVSQVRRPLGKTAREIGAFVGAVVDTVVLVSLASDGSPPPRRDEEFSCPFVYAYDGHTFQKQAEVFGGAIFEKAQRTDWVRLDALGGEGGIYRVRVTNELAETQYVDAVSLLAVDHAPGTAIVPSASGQIHVLGDVQPPRAATDLAGRTVLDLVAASDERVWSGSPFNVGDGPVRDGIVMDFARPAGATSATLSFRVQNTVWASYLQGQMLALQGRDLDAWYAKLNTSAVDRRRLYQAMVREGMLRLEVWTGDGWRDAGHVWEVGPVVPREQAVALDLQGTPEGTLRVRATSTVGLWIVDSVAADFAAAAPVRVTELTPRRAFRVRDGADRRAALASVDSDRVAMASGDDDFELEFDAPPVAPGLTRSVIVKASGYYTIHATPTGDPNPELIERLLDEPGAYGRYTLALLERYRTAQVASSGPPPWR